MKQIILLILLTVLIPLDSHAGEEYQCMYNQDAFKEMYVPIKKQYKHTKYLKNEKALEVRLKDSKVIVRYFGCQHYGTEIKYFEDRDRTYTDKEIFDKTIDLINRFGQKRIKTDVLGDLLKNGTYQKIEPRTFLVDYPDMDGFSIIVDDHAGEPLIVIGFYY